MSELITKWLNDEVRLSRHVKEFQQDFANGYLFAELLHRYGKLDDLSAFADSTSLAAKRQNFARLKIAVTGAGLGVTLKDGQINEMIDQDRGASLRFLFQLKTALGPVGKSTSQTRKQPIIYESEAAKAEAVKEAATRLHCGKTSNPVKKAIRVERQRYGDPEEHLYETQLKSIKRLDPRVRHIVHVKEFSDEHERQRKHGEESLAQEKQGFCQRQVDFRQSRIDVMHESNARKEAAIEEGRKHGIATKISMLAAVERDLEFEKHTIRREIRKADRIRELHEKDCGYLSKEHQGELQGISWFEQNLQSIGIDISGEGGPSEATIVATSFKEMHEKMQQKLPHTAELQIESEKRMKLIKDAKKSHDQAWRERSDRQHRGMLEQRDAHAAGEIRRCEQDLLAEFLRTTAEYRQEAAAYDMEQRHRRASALYRSSLQQELATRAERDSEEAYQRMAAKCREDRRIDLERRKLANAQGLSGRKCGNSVKAGLTDSSEEEQVIQLVEKKVSKRASVMILQGLREAEPVKLIRAKEILEIVGDPYLSTYIFKRGTWQNFRSQKDCPQPLRPKLGSIVRCLLEPGPVFGEHVLPKGLLPIWALDSGPSLLSTQGVGLAVAKRICKDHSFALLEPRRVIAEFIALARQRETEPEYPPLGRAYQIGKVLLDAHTKQGNAAHMDHGLYIELIFRKIELLSAPPRKEVEEDAKTKAKSKAKAKAKGKPVVEEEEPEIEKPKGIVILCFPSELRQLAVWEASIQKYLSPLLCVRESDNDSQAQISAIVAPWRSVDEPSPYKVRPLPVLDRPPPVRFLRLRYSSHEALCEAVVKEGASKDAWETLGIPGSLRIPTQEGENEVPTVRCLGYDYEQACTASPADRAWLYEEMQRLLGSFAAPLGGVADIVAEAFETLREDQRESTVDSCYTQASELLKINEVASPDIQVPLDSEAKIEDANGTMTVGFDPEPWLAADLSPEIKVAWVQGVAEYFADLRASFRGLQAHRASFAQELIQLQREFSLFLQKEEPAQGAVLLDFIRTWASFDYAGTPKDRTFENLDELSEQLWQFVDLRRSAALEEAERIMSSTFWGEHVCKVLSWIAKLQLVEWQRYQAAEALLAQAYCYADLLPSMPYDENIEVDNKGNISFSPDDSRPVGIATVKGAEDWLLERSAMLISKAVDFDGEDHDEPLHQDFLPALAAQRWELTTQLHTVVAFAAKHLAGLRADLDEAFRRMDDWVRDWVRNADDAIRASMRLLSAGPPPDVVESLRNPDLRKSSKQIQFSPTHSTPFAKETGAVRRWRKDVRALLEPRAMQLDLFQPHRSLDNGLSAVMVSAGSHSPLVTATQGSSSPRSDSAFPIGKGECWHESMLLALLTRLRDRLGGELPVHVAPGTLLEVLLDQREEAFRLESLGAVPSNWVKRSPAAIETVCEGMSFPAWGLLNVDITELLITFSLHGRSVSWPDFESLQLSKDRIEKASLPGSYPDVPVSEELFIELPLWKTGVEESWRRWLFWVLACFENPDNYMFPDNRNASATVSARRLFAYLGLGRTPSEGLWNLLRLLIPSHEVWDGRDGREKPLVQHEAQGLPVNEVLVRNVWTIAYSLKSRPSSVAPSPRSLESFCRELVPPPLPPEEPAVPPKKGQPPPPIVEIKPQLPPDREVVAFDEVKLMRSSAILGALCTHGALLCRKKGLQVLFPGAAGANPASAAPLWNIADFAAQQKLAPLAPEIEQLCGSLKA